MKLFILTLIGVGLFGTPTVKLNEVVPPAPATAQSVHQATQESGDILQPALGYGAIQGDVSR